jgi:hypothetical protein
VWSYDATTRVLATSLGCLLLLGAAAATAHAAPGVESGFSASAPGSGSVAAAAVTASGDEEHKKILSRWRGSVLLFDQSVTTQTVGVGADYQSYNPTYEWWIALKPRYTIYEGEADVVSVSLWMNLYLELTNSDTSTRYREPLLGPTYLWGTYGHTFRDLRGYKTAATIGPRLTFPTEKAAYDSGQILGLGAMAGASQTLPLAGKLARAMQGARLGIGTIYNYWLNRSTSPVNGDLRQLRQDLGFGPLVSDVLRPGMNVRESLSIALSGDLQILRKLGLSLSYVSLSSWRYSPPSAHLILDTGPIAPTDVAGATTYGVSTWTTAALSYDVMDELSLSLGYYNMANQLAPSGLRRDPSWSPAARFFLTLTGNLDAILHRVAGKDLASASIR